MKFTQETRIEKSRYWPSLLLLGLFFICGAFAGSYFSAAAQGGGETALSEYITGFVTASGQSITSPSLFGALVSGLRFPLLIFCCGLTPFGVFAIPVIFSARGFFLSFTITSFYRILGQAGLRLALAVFGLPGLLSVSVLFVLGLQGFLNSGLILNYRRGKNSRINNKINKDYFWCGAICLFLLLLSAILEISVTPKLITAAANQYLG